MANEEVRRAISTPVRLIETGPHKHAFSLAAALS
jgi:hypothetical protein